MVGTTEAASFGAGAATALEGSDVFEIGDDVELDLSRREVRKRGALVPVQPRVFDVLCYLVEHRARVVTKAELLDSVWSGDVVVPDVLTTALHVLRRALGDDRKKPGYVRTVHRVGYRLVADVRRKSEPGSEQPSSVRFPALEARHATFVGRRSETALFEDMLAGKSDVHLLFVHGLPGIGKTTLLQELAYRARRAGRDHLWLAGESVGPFVDAFVRALAGALGCASDVDRVRESLAARPRVLFVDDVHVLQGVDEWMRQELWPSLPASVHLVLAGRHAPSARWRCDPAWTRAARALELAALGIDEARALLERHGALAGHADELWSRTGGHPLALTLAVDVLRNEEPLRSLERLDTTFDPETLVAWFTDHLADAARLRALEVACVLDEVSAPVLAALDADPEQMQWLSTLPFVEVAGSTVRVHALVRDAVIDGLARRDAAHLAALLERCHRHFRAEFRRASDAATKYRAVQIVMGIGRYHPALRANYAAADAGPECTVRPATADDHGALVEAVTRHEGAAPARIVETWLAHPSTQVWCVCDETAAALGFLVTLRIGVTGDAAAQAAGDPLVAGLLRHLREKGGVRAGDEVLVHRAMLARDDYQAPSIVTRHLHTLKWFWLMWYGTLSTTLSHVVSFYGEGDLWQAPAESAGLVRVPELEVELGKRRFTPFLASLRDEPIDEWLAKSCERVIEALRSSVR